MAELQIKITINPASDTLLAAISEAADAAGVIASATDTVVQHYDASGGSHKATFVTLVGSALSTALKKVSAAIMEYVQLVNRRGIEIKIGDRFVRVDSVQDLDAAVSALERMERAAITVPTVAAQAALPSVSPRQQRLEGPPDSRQLPHTPQSESRPLADDGGEAETPEGQQV